MIETDRKDRDKESLKGDEKTNTVKALIYEISQNDKLVNLIKT
jgi:hypothetical protein